MTKEIIANWPEKSREAAQLVIDKYGEPDEATDSLLIWHKPGPWKRMIAYKQYFDHDFPAPHIDAVESIINYTVPPETLSDLAKYDGSITYRRTDGELSAKCHDEAANFLALNLAYDIISGKRTFEEAKEHYKKEFLDFRRKEPTPYMEQLNFEPESDSNGNPGEANITDEEMKQAKSEGSAK